MKKILSRMSLVERVCLCLGIMLFILTGVIACFTIAFNATAFDILLLTASIMIIVATIPRMFLGSGR